MIRFLTTYTSLLVFFIYSCSKDSSSVDPDTGLTDDPSISEPNNIVSIENEVVHNAALLNNLLNLVSQESLEVDLDDVSKKK